MTPGHPSKSEKRRGSLRAALEPDIRAAIQNEQITRERVDRLEDALMGFVPVAVVIQRGFWGRMRWLFTGK